MTTSVYPTYRALGRPIRFKGFQAQYIILAGISLIGDLLLFIVLYTCKVEPWICIALAMGLGAGGLWTIAHFSHRYSSPIRYDASRYVILL